MEATGILTQNVDKTQLPPLHQKRVLAFVNHFLITSCGFLNDFALQCETKFIELERKLQKVEAALTILEAKLASIPDKENKDNLIKESLKQTTVTTEKTEKDTVDLKVDDVSTEPEVEINVKGIIASQHSSYKKFFKMLQVGVPAPAVKLKMQAEGVDPTVLDNPNMIILLEDDEQVQS